MLHGSSTTDFNPNEIIIKEEQQPVTVPRSMIVCEARRRLDRQLNETFRFHRTIEQPGFVERRLKQHPYPDKMSLEAMCQVQFDSLRKWRAACYEMELALADQMDNKDRLSLYELELQYLRTMNTLATLFATTPMVFDSYNADFAHE